MLEGGKFLDLDIFLKKEEIIRLIYLSVYLILMFIIKVIYSNV